MTALAANRHTRNRVGSFLEIPVKAAVHIFAGGMVMLEAASRLAIPGADTVSCIFAGIAVNEADNSGGGNGAIKVLVQTDGLHLLVGAGLAQTDVGKTVYISDDQTVATTGTVNAIACGKIMAIESATEPWILINTAVNLAATLAAGSVTLADSGDYFGTDTAEAALAVLAKGGRFITIPRFTGWVKDGTAKSIAIPNLESPIAMKVVRAYANLGTAPGAGKTLTLAVNGSTVITIADTDTQGESEALAVAIAANVDLTLTASETAAGAAENADLILLVVPNAAV